MTATDSGSLQYNLSAPLSGIFYNGSAGGQGMLGRFWSSTMSPGSGMYSLSVSSSNANPQYDDYRNLGYSVRCLLQ